MTLKFYYDNLSQPCRALEIFLKINKIPFEPKFIHLASGEHLENDYAKINPFKKVPVIDDKGFILSESVAIFRYLCREKNVPDHWYPKESRKQARVDQYLEWQHNETRAHCSLYFRVKFLEPILTGKEPRESRVASFKRRMQDVCDLIETVWLKDKEFITGSEITIADLLAITELEQLKPTGYDPREGRPRIAAWMDRVRKETSPFYDKVHKRINKLAQKANSIELSKL